MLRMSQRLADSKRNKLIANFMEEKEEPEYEGIPSKTTKGRYTVMKRKASLPYFPYMLLKLKQINGSYTLEYC